MMVRNMAPAKDETNLSQSGLYARWYPKQVPMVVAALLLLLTSLPQYHSAVPACSLLLLTSTTIPLK